MQTAQPPRFSACAPHRAAVPISQSAPRLACGVVLAALLVSACNLITPYRMDIQQGNVVTQEMVAKLQPGMTRSQVRFALGTPLIVDPFRLGRWDYVYLYSKQGEVTERRRIVVVFKDDKLVAIEGDVVPRWKERPGESAPPAEKPAAEKPVAEKPVAEKPVAEKPVAAPTGAPVPM